MMFGDWYVIENGKVRPAKSMLEAARFFGNLENRRVDRTDITPKIYVSTVFLGLDHNHNESGFPILFETMVFGGKLSGDCRRASTLGEAKKNHWDAVDEVRSSLDGTQL